MASGTWGDPNVYTKAETDAAIAQSTATVTGVTGESVGSDTIVEYPAGYTKQNCMVIGFKYLDGDNRWRTFGVLNGDNPCVLTVALDSKIYITVRKAAAANKNFALTMIKI